MSSFAGCDQGWGAGDFNCVCFGAGATKNLQAPVPTLRKRKTAKTKERPTYLKPGILTSNVSVCSIKSVVTSYSLKLCLAVVKLCFMITMYSMTHCNAMKLTFRVWLHVTLHATTEEKRSWSRTKKKMQLRSWSHRCEKREFRSHAFFAMAPQPWLWLPAFSCRWQRSVPDSIKHNTTVPLRYAENSGK